jgi:hypothetical protein
MCLATLAVGRRWRIDELGRLVLKGWIDQETLVWFSRLLCPLVLPFDNPAIRKPMV